MPNAAKVAKNRRYSDFLRTLPVIGDFFPERPVSINSIVISLMAISLFLTRPTALGEVYTLPGIIIALTLSVIFMIFVLRGQQATKYDFSIQTVIYLIYVVYIFALIFTGRPLLQDFLFKAIFIGIVGVIISGIVSSSRDRATTFFDSIARIIIALSFSTIATVALIVAGANAQSLTIAFFNYTYPAPTGTILFPFSMVYNYAPSWFGLMPRLSGFFREVGVFPAFACWAAGYAAYRRWSLLSVAGCLVASVLSLSSLGSMLALLTFGGIVGQRLRLPWWAYVVVGPATAAVIVIVTYNLPYIGIGTKYQTVNASYTERMYATKYALDIANPLFGQDANGDRNEGINLISSIRIYGLFGVGLLSSIFLASARSIRFFVAALLAPLITAVFSQPIAAEPLFILLFFSWRAFPGKINPMLSFKKSQHTAASVTSRQVT